MDQAAPVAGLVPDAACATFSIAYEWASFAYRSHKR